MLLGEGTIPPCAMDPGASVSGHRGWGDGVPMCSEGQEDEGKPEWS